MQPTPKLPDWLNKTEIIPQTVAKPDRFLIQNLRLLTAILSRLAQPTIRHQSTRQTPGIQLLSLLITILIVVLTHSFLLIWLIGLLTLIRICVLPGQQIGPLLKRVASISLVALALILPNFWLGHAETTWYFIIRTEIILFNIGFFLQLITWPAFILALRQLKLPGLLVLTLEISLKYSHLLAQFLQESLWAIRLRSTGKAQKRQHLIGSLIGRLYLSARAYMTELYQAMLLRGYTGHVNQQASLTITRYDWRLISWDLTLICLFCFIRR